jgi:hypothetical protein
MADDHFGNGVEPFREDSSPSAGGWEGLWKRVSGPVREALRTSRAGVRDLAWKVDEPGAEVPRAGGECSISAEEGDGIGRESARTRDELLDTFEEGDGT